MSSMKRAFISAVAVAAIGGIAYAEDMKKEIGPGEGQVDIVAWPGYIERGESDKAYDWVTDFEKSTGCKVTVKTAGEHVIVNTDFVETQSGVPDRAKSHTGGELRARRRRARRIEREFRVETTR